MKTNNKSNLFTLLIILLLIFLDCKGEVKKPKIGSFTEKAWEKNTEETLLEPEIEILEAIENEDLDKLVSFFGEKVSFGTDYVSEEFKKETDLENFKNKKSIAYQFIFNFDNIKNDAIRFGFDGQISFLSALKNFDKFYCLNIPSKGSADRSRKLVFQKFVKDKFSMEGKRNTFNTIWLKCNLSNKCLIYYFEIN